MNRIIRFRLMALVAVCLSVSAFAQDKTVKKIIETGKNDNQVMVHSNHLANYIGGRPIGSSALTHAEAWAKEMFESWGLEVMVQEAGEINVGFDRGPWFGRMLSEDGFPLHFGTPAYTAPTRGKQVGHVMVEPKSRREFERMKGALKGAWVLLDAPSTGMAIDWSDKANQDRAEIIKQNEEIDRQNMEIRAYNMTHRDEAPKEMLPYKQITAPFYKEMVEAGVLGFIRSAAVPLRVMYDRANCYNITMENLPTVCDICLDEAQFKVIKEKVLRKDIFQLEFDIRNHFFRGPVKYHNIIGIIRGSKYPNEYVLTGGHLDAYDNGTGAVDDGNGTSLNMEVARLLATSGAKPKRSIMICLWTGEEYGLLGSKFFVENKTVPLEKISNYFNRDGGPLMSIGITVPPAMYDDFVEVCKPIMDLNPEVPFTVTKRPGEPRPRPTSAGGSDHAYFAMNGVPTVSFQESDPFGKNFEYQEIWHTERDIYNKVIPEYMEHSATVTAVVVYGLANLDHQLSRQGLYKE
ncbi:MAG: M20/M25/M40 family metallo-hydrolase [Bacteroidales bacterium]|nr:M20/M25/M40 family metallo-hydrolase [Bacteroidales bacterium]